MPLGELGFIALIVGQFNQLRVVIADYVAELEDTDEDIELSEDIYALNFAFTDYLLHDFLQSATHTTTVRFDAINRLITFYRQMSILLIDQEWEGNFSYDAMRNALSREVDVDFLITQAEHQLDLVNASINENVESIIDTKNAPPTDPLFARIIQIRVLLRVLRQNANNANREATIQQVIVHMHTLDAYLDYEITRLDMEYDVSMPVFFTLYPAIPMSDYDDPADDNEDVDL